MLVIPWALLPRVHSEETLFQKDLLYYVCVCVCACGGDMCIWIQGPAEARRGDQELELQAVTSHPRWVLGPNSDLLEEQEVLLTTGSLQLL